MRLKVILPTEILLEVEVTKVNAEAANGALCLLPRHVDFVTALVPGLLSFVPAVGQETFVAVDEGILVKCGAEVLVSTLQAIQGPDLGSLRRLIEERFRVLDAHDRQVRTAVARLETSLVRRLLELRDHGV